MAQEKFDIFISYSRKDAELADKICAALENAGVDCFIDREGISTGEDFVNKITHNIENSQFFLFLASKNAYEAKFTPKEVLFAIDYKPKESIIPYIIDGSPIDKKYKFLISDINYQTIEQCPIEPDLVDDILKRLGRQRKVNEITKDYLLSLPDDEFESFKDNGKYGFKLKSTGEIVIPSRYDYTYSFREGLACVEMNGKYGFIDKTGKEVIPLNYDNAGNFINGLVRVKSNNKEIFIDKNGECRTYLTQYWELLGGELMMIVYVIVVGLCCMFIYITFPSENMRTIFYASGALLAALGFGWFLMYLIKKFKNK